MLTGRQIQKARQLLRLGTAELAARSGVEEDCIRRAEAVEGQPPITLAHGAAIQRALERDGVVFTLASAHLRKLTLVSGS